MSIEKSVIQTIVDGYKRSRGRKGKDQTQFHPSIQAAEALLNGIVHEFLDEPQLLEVVTCFIVHPAKAKHPSDRVFLKLLDAVRKVKTKSEAPTDPTELTALRDLLMKVRPLDERSFDMIMRSNDPTYFLGFINSINAAPAVQPIDPRDAQIQALTAEVVRLNTQSVSALAAHTAAQNEREAALEQLRQKSAQQTLHIQQQQKQIHDLGQQSALELSQKEALFLHQHKKISALEQQSLQELRQKGLIIQQQQTQLDTSDQQLAQAAEMLTRAQTALSSQATQVKELRAFAQSQEGLIAQQKVTLQQQKTLLDNLSAEFLTLTSEGFTLIDLSTASLTTACTLFKKAVSKPKKKLLSKDQAQAFRDKAREEFLIKKGPVYDAIEKADAKILPLIEGFKATKNTGTQYIDELDDLIYPEGGSILPDELKGNVEEEKEISAVLAITLKPNSPRAAILSEAFRTATHSITPTPGNTAAPASGIAPAPPPPPPPFSAPPAPSFKSGTTKSHSLSSNPNSLVSHLGDTDLHNNNNNHDVKASAPNTSASATPAKDDHLDLLRKGTSTLKKTTHLEDLAKPKEVKPVIDPFFARVAAEKAAREAREERKKQAAIQEAEFAEKMAKRSAAIHGDIDECDWSDESNSM